MGGFLAGLLGGIGDHLHERNLVNAQYQHQANQEMATVLDHLAQTARDPIHQQEYATLALKYRALPMGKKPTKDMDLSNVMYKQVQGVGGQGQPGQPGQVGGQGASGQGQGQQATLPPPPKAGVATNPTSTGPASNPGPSLSQLPPEWSDAAHANSALPPPPGMGSTNGDAVALDQRVVGGPSVIGPPPQAQPQPQAAPQAMPAPQPGKVTSQNITPATPLPPPPGASAAPSAAAPVASGQASGAAPTIPPPPSGQPNMPGGGMADAGNPNIIAGGGVPSTGFGLPPNTGYFQGDDGKLYRSASFLPRELTQMGVAAEEAKQRALNQAELERQEGLSSFNRQENMKLIDQFKKQGVRHIQWSIGANGQPTIKPDLGKPIPGLMQGSEADGEAQDLKGNPLDPNKFYRVKEYSDGSRDYVPQLGVTTKQVMPDQNSPTGFSVVWSDRAGRPVATQPGATPPMGYAPEQVTTNGGHDVVVDLGDHKEVWHVNSNNSTTRQRVIPGVTPGTTPPTFAGSPGTASNSGGGGVSTLGTPPKRSTIPPPPGSNGNGVVGGGGGVAGNRGEKGLQPYQAMTAMGKLGALNNTRDLVQSVQKDLPVLNSLLDAKKIEMQIDPKQGFIKALINRNVPLSPQEARLAANFQSLMEHINTIRGPLGATGFRGPEAFAALQNQRGNLSSNPAVTKQVLANTLRALNSQADALNYGLSRGKRGATVTPPPSDESDTGAGTGEEGTGTVSVRRKSDGVTGEIPASKLKAALASGLYEQM